MKRKQTKNILQDSLGRVALGTAAILSIPLIAVQFSDDVNWGLEDFVVVGIVLLCFGLLFEWVRTKIKNKTHRVVISLTLIAALLYVWAELAVGIFTNLGN